MISWATNAEDVVLSRSLLGGFGTYVDLGAADPDEGSATRLLAERGWYGISVTAGPGAAARHRERRPGDVTLELPAGVAPPRTLDIVLEDFSRGPLDLLRIGSAAPAGAVLAGVDLARWRPRVVLVEAVDPASGAGDDDEAWRAPLEAAGYTEALFDGVNHFFAPADDPELLARLAVPASSLDGYEPWAAARLAEALAGLQERVRMLERSLDEHSGVAAGSSRLAAQRSLHVPEPPAGLPHRRAASTSPTPAPSPPARLALVGDPGAWRSWMGEALAAALSAELLRAEHPADLAWGSLPGSVVVDLAWPRTRLLERSLAAAAMAAVCHTEPADAGSPAGWGATWTSTPATVGFGLGELFADPTTTLAAVLAGCGLTPAFSPEAVVARLGPPPRSRPGQSHRPRGHPGPDARGGGEPRVDLER